MGERREIGEEQTHTPYIQISLTEDAKPNAIGSANNDGVESYQLF